MKKITSILTTLMLFFGIAFTTTSCSENEPHAVPAAKSVAGTYTGDMTCSVMGTDQVFENLTFKVTSVDDATVTVEIPSFGEAPMQMPAITVAKVPVAGADGTYTLAVTNFDGTASTGRAYSGHLGGGFANNTLTIQFELHYGAMPMALVCTFVAEKK